MRRVLFTLGLVLGLAACGAPTCAGLGGATTQSVALQGSDVPKGLQKCPATGDINSYLDQLKKKDPSTYQSTNDQWQKEKKAGATAGYVSIYSDQTAECDSFLGGKTPSGKTPPKIMINIVVQFKDDTSAAKDYKTSFFGFSTSDMKSAGGSVTEGKNTGLGNNSAVGSVNVFGVSLYFAVWQNKAFESALVDFNIADANSKKATSSINGRIH
ncbi:MAG TPA: hypothetical protein VK131_14040 [Candidatus Acidoferrales bacterium]|nr:hypothetical protein [Candidatus Acidoferrales bacterium]